MDAHDRLCWMPVSCLASHADALAYVQPQDTSGITTMWACDIRDGLSCMMPISCPAAHADALAGVQIRMLQASLLCRHLRPCCCAR